MSNNNNRPTIIEGAIKAFHAIYDFICLIVDKMLGNK